MSAKRTGKRSRAREPVPRGRADLGSLRAVGEREIRETSPEELADLPSDFWNEAELVLPVAKQPISLRVDKDVLEWFRSLGPGYQTRMNAVLRSYMNRAASHARRSRSGSRREP